MKHESDAMTSGSGDEAKTVFVVSPIGTPGTAVAVNAKLALEYIIREALPEPEWEVVRADEETDPGSITNLVIERIVNSDLIVADLTGHNPNVFYELAVAHGYKKPVVTIMTEGEKVPFDIVDMRTVFYDLANPASVHTAKAKLRASACAVLDNPNPTNPLVAHSIFSTANNGADATPSDRLEFTMGQILARLSHLESRLDGVKTIQHGVTKLTTSSRGAHVVRSDDEEEVLVSLAERQAEIANQLNQVTADIRVLKSKENRTADDDLMLEHLHGRLRTWRRRARTHGVSLAEPE